MKPEGTLQGSQQLSIINTMNHMNPVHNFPYNVLKIYFNIILFSTAVL